MGSVRLLFGRPSPRNPVRSVRGLSPGAVSKTSRRAKYGNKWPSRSEARARGAWPPISAIGFAFPGGSRERSRVRAGGLVGPKRPETLYDPRTSSPRYGRRRVTPCRFCEASWRRCSMNGGAIAPRASAAVRDPPCARARTLGVARSAPRVRRTDKAPTGSSRPRC